jgi:hypothetical protein
LHSASAHRTTTETIGNPSCLRMTSMDLDDYRKALDDLVVDIQDPRALAPSERLAMRERLRRANMVIYRCVAGARMDRTVLAAFTRQLGLGKPDQNLLAANDGLSEVEVKNEGHFSQYIPYTNRSLNWHSDGYYLTGDRIIRTMLLHCMSPAAKGGSLEAIDHRVLYHLLAERDVRFPQALSRRDAMTIPAHHDHGAAREDSTGPVFFVEGNTLRMRYTARQHNVRWAADVLFQDALSTLKELFENHPDLRYRRRLAEGEGILCANVPHRRDAFEDGDKSQSKRLMYRGRFTESLKGTG